MFKLLGFYLIRIYQLLVSPLLGSNKCRFQPNCSHYGLQAINRHGMLKGSILTGLRILRCNPLTTGGVDPVPRKFNYRQVKK